MEMNQRLEACRTCQLKMFSPQGLVCGLTSQKPTFNDTCPDYVEDEKQAFRTRNAANKTEEFSLSSNDLDFKITWKSIVSAIIFMIAVFRLVSLFF